VSDLSVRLDPELRDRLRPAEPAWRRPLLATLADAPFSDPDWIFEPKFDGVRAIAVRDGAETHLISRNEKVMDPAYPELVEALGALGRERFVVDGEIVAFEDGRTSFSRLQQRMGLQDPERARRTGVTVYLYLFDLLNLDGYDTTDLPLRDRRALLRDELGSSDPIRFSAHRNEHGEAYFEAACAEGWEGLIAKRADSTYRSGRSRDWLKLKCVNEQEFVIVGFTEPSGSRQGFGALLVGYHDDDGLRYAGKVGTGYSDRLLRELRADLDDLVRDQPPVIDEVREKGAHWVEPRLVAAVGFTEWTGDGRLRHPRFEGLRDDKDPSEIVREVPS
jgi:bifunctional non-homologous end joining protein LigD